MNLNKVMKCHEHALEVVEFLSFLETVEKNLLTANLEFKQWSGRDLSFFQWKCQVIKRARNYAHKKYTNLLKELI
jgi:hypothetical protein